MYRQSVAVALGRRRTVNLTFTLSGKPALTMKTFAYFPAGRKFWFDLAAKLHGQKVATPVMWLGDPRLDRLARDAFPDCEVLPANRMRAGTIEDPPKYSGEFGDFWRSDNYHRAKDRAMKLLDRIDWFGTHRNVTREVFINALCAWGLASIKKSNPNFLLMSESPHAPATYVFYEIFRYLELDVYSFSAFVYSPGMLLKKDGIEGAALVIPPAARNELFSEIVDDELPRWVSRLLSEDPDEFDPEYMRRQRQADLRQRRRQNFITALMTPIRLPLAPIRRKISSRYSIDLEPRESTRNFFREDKIYPRNTLSIRKTIRDRLDRLGVALTKETEDMLPERFIYFPLHYEPERTSNPEGGEFHDQFKCLAVVRSLLPDDVAICIKEHPSQLMRTRRGFMGRSPGFYRAVKAISGVQIVPIDMPSRLLIEKCMFVATLTGSAAHEAAYLQKRGLTFGTTWFEGCPNTHRFADGVDFAALTEPVEADGEAVERWLTDRAKNFCVPGCVNPGNERALKKFYKIEGFREAELEASFEFLRHAIEA